ncbi:MAG TPA: transposase [Candidatus Krumholzibacteriaceae bacterium]|nr:transposase [Candidatus Krumholzibacteriaceae bacterium]
MLPLVEFPEIVQHYAPFFQDVFSAEALIEFKRYISGLIVSENKTVDGINRLFVTESRNQSSLNRMITKSPFSLGGLNQARLTLLNSLPGTQMKPKGVFSVDDTLLSHYGQDFEQIAQLWDHVSGTYVWAHDLVTIHYSDNETDYPVLFQLWEPVDITQLEAGIRAAGIPLKASKEAWKESDPQKWRGYLLGVWRRRQKSHAELQELYDSKLIIVERLLQQWVEAHPGEERPITFDNWFTQPAFCRFLNETLKLPYVGTLAETDKVNLSTGQISLKDFADRLKTEHLQALQDKTEPVFRKIGISYKSEQETYYSYCNTHHIHNFGKQRLVINYRQADLSDNPIFLISNRLYWNSPGITRIRRHRWPVEVYHEEGKAEGLDQYQLRSFSAIQRHVALVAVVYSILRAAQHDPALQEKLQRQLQSKLEGHPAAWRRASQAQSLWCLALFISTGLTQGQSLQQILAPLIKLICRS